MGEKQKAAREKLKKKTGEERAGGITKKEIEKERKKTGRGRMTNGERERGGECETNKIVVDAERA